ncbi:hypothetical protein B0H13DRAFT_2267093 [Mycena leptocephala]|nr:hypothetical protein B0H13DRAFT_2267093 [Mycena leptocephala]
MTRLRSRRIGPQNLGTCPLKGSGGLYCKVPKSPGGRKAAIPNRDSRRKQNSGVCDGKRRGSSQDRHCTVHEPLRDGYGTVLDAVISRTTACTGDDNSGGGSSILLLPARLVRSKIAVPYRKLTGLHKRLYGTWVEGHPSFLVRQNSVWFSAVTVENEVILAERPNLPYTTDTVPFLRSLAVEKQKNSRAQPQLTTFRHYVNRKSPNQGYLHPTPNETN